MAKRSPKRALCIGTNYVGTGYNLSGCINDVLDWSELLQKRGFTVSSLVEERATRENILTAISEHVGNAKMNDSVIITFSGHGTFVRDLDGDEDDQNDEAICPHDVTDGAIITDDELYRLFNERGRRVKVAFISDSCHSGTLTRFAREPGAAIVRVGERDFPSRVATKTRVRFLPPTNIKKLKKSLMPTAAMGTRNASTAMTSALLLGGSRDFEYSYDAWFEGRANGAFTRNAIDTFNAMPKTPKATYAKLFSEVRKRLPSQQYPQSPQLFGTYDQKRWLAL